MGRSVQRKRLCGSDACALLRLLDTHSQSGTEPWAGQGRRGRLRHWLSREEVWKEVVSDMRVVQEPGCGDGVLTFMSECSASLQEVRARGSKQEVTLFLRNALRTLVRAAERSSDARTRRFKYVAKQSRWFVPNRQGEVTGVEVGEVSLLAQYPAKGETVQCKVGRAPVRLELVGSRLETGRFSIEEGQADLPVVHRGTQSTVEVRRLLERTERWFPSTAKAGATKVAIPNQLARAVEEVGWGIVGRGQLMRLTAARASTAQWSKLLRKAMVPTATAVAAVSKAYVLKKEASGVSVTVLSCHQWASLMGVPISRWHPLRLALTAVSDDKGSSMVGQAVDADVAKEVLRWACVEAGVPLDGRRKVWLATALSGLDFFAGALFDMLGSDAFGYAAAAEVVESVLEAHAAGWGGLVGKVFGSVLSAATRRGWSAAAAQAEVVAAGLRCSAWSRANTAHGLRSAQRRQQLHDALAECQAVVDLMLQPAVKVAIFETADGLLAPRMAGVWAQFQRTFGRHTSFEWRRFLLCPSKGFGKRARRRRLFIVGTRRGE
jgi:hypothetical protein